MSTAPRGSFAGKIPKVNNKLTHRHQPGGSCGRGCVFPLHRSPLSVAGTTSDAANAWLKAGQVADWPATRFLRAYCLCRPHDALRGFQCRWSRSTPRHPCACVTGRNLHSAHLAGLQGGAAEARRETGKGQSSRERKTERTGPDGDIKRPSPACSREIPSWV